ncbi:helix-turn-helix domain-containing protein [Aequorivita antarctica]|uniref:Helix-turn-helix domain-containing protein n=1 Tax=Aequorivita antarctica TaxID=153266 RepID=A0A5C6Z1R2_9FLAO|nr:helix-turn-helix domain-containing protein [Aequorivita antarctica]TXD73927.1 helix-turn-helix domain-containing protein [Aequorivita antarctica]SRX73353.1 hypothetical protein AEQU3_00789 [Aequorivita antarctica]
MKNIYLEGSSEEEFMAKLCQKFREILTEKNETPVIDKVELLSRKETAKFLNITLVTLHNWTKSKLIKPYYKGRRVYYKKCEIVASLTSIES